MMNELWVSIQSFMEPAFTRLPMLLLVVAGLFIAQRLLGKVLQYVANTTSLTPAETVPFQKVASTGIYFLALILALTVLGVNLGGLWAILTTVLAMVAIGFVAVWSLLSNISSAVLIFALRPFVIGDEIGFPDEPVKGCVTDINFMFTTLRTSEGVLLQIPNNHFFQKTLRRSTRGSTPPKAPPSSDTSNEKDPRDHALQ